MGEGATFDKYLLLERIGIGGSAEVFRARRCDDPASPTVVLKRVLPHLAKDPRFLQVFRDEALIASQLSHPNIVKLLDFGRSPAGHFLVLELVDGGSLDALLDHTPVAPQYAIALSKAIGLALGYLHSYRTPSGVPLPIVHRDVSPHNVLVSRSGEVKLADFGIARSAFQQGHTEEGVIKGKLCYMSPEQATPGAPLDSRTDIFSLGVLLYRLIFGRLPFSGRDEIDTLSLLRATRLSFPALEFAERAAVCRLLERCLARQVEARIATAEQLVKELDAIAARLAEVAPLSVWVSQRLDASRASDPLVLGLLGQSPRQTELVAGARSATPSATMGESPRALPRRAIGRQGLIPLLALIGALVAAAVVLGTRPPKPPTAQQPAIAVDASFARSSATKTPVASLPTDAARTGVRDSGLQPTVSLSKPTDRRPQKHYGRLFVNAIPWARVYVDGRYLGTTPLIDKPLRIGRRTVVLKAADGALLKAARITVRKDRIHRISYDRRRR